MIAGGALVWVLAALTACGPGPESGTEGASGTEGTPRVVATIFPVADLARRIGGDDVRVSTLLPAGASPATFEVSPGTLREVREARVLIVVGGGLDPWARELVEGAGGVRTVTLLEGLELRGRGDAEGTGNPHVWLDPIRTRDRLLPRLARAVVAAVPDARTRIEARTRALADTLAALDWEIRSTLRPVAGRDFVASHPAWSYYAERYGLRQVGIVHRRPGQQPSARALADLVEEARAAGVPVVFGEPQVPDAAARALAAELDVPVVPLDPLGGPGVEGRDSYTALLRYNTAQFLRGLGRDQDGR